jgi:hypothetical protein
MNKNVITLISFNKTVTLFRVKPFYFSFKHVSSFTIEIPIGYCIRLNEKK